MPIVPKRCRGFTLIELMVVVAIFVIMLAMAVPAFTRMLAADRMTTQTNEILVGLNATKSEAIRRSQPITLRARDDSNPNDFHRGWLTFTDADADGAAGSPVTESEGTVLRDVMAMTGTTTVTRVTRAGTAPNFTYPAATSSVNGRQFITFTERGGITGGAAAFFRICDTSYPTVPGRIVQVSIVGKVSLDSTTENCAAS